MSKPFEITVEAVFVLRGRGVAIAGAHKGGEIRTGDRAELVDDQGTIPIDEVRVEVHRPLGKLAVVLVGVDRDQVHVGQVLRKPRPPRKTSQPKEPGAETRDQVRQGTGS